MILETIFLLFIGNIYDHMKINETLQRQLKIQITEKFYGFAFLLITFEIKGLNFSNPKLNGIIKE